MKVKFEREHVTNIQCFRAGLQCDLDDELAQKLIDQGVCKSATPPPAPKPARKRVAKADTTTAAVDPEQQSETR